MQVALAGEANAKDISLPFYFKRYFDLRKEVHKFYSPGQHEHLRGKKNPLLLVYTPPKLKIAYHLINQD